MNTKLPPTRPRIAAFTLLEILTVIAIIAILMGLLLTVVGSSKTQARYAEATTALKDIVIAAKSYQTDAGFFPRVDKARIDAGSGDGFYAYGDVTEGKCAVSNDVLFDILRDIDRGENANHAMNKRRQPYMQTKVAKDSRNPRSGFCDGSAFAGRQGQYMDPWGAQYCVVLSASGDEGINMGRFYSDLSGPENLVRVSAAGFSMGTDSKRGGKGFEGKLRKGDPHPRIDDVVSWL